MPVAATERFFKILRDVLLLTEEVKRLNNQNEKLGDKLDSMDRRLTRIETIAELSVGQRLLPNKH